MRGTDRKGRDQAGGRELLVSVTRKDLHLDTFRSGGKGGQNQNKRETGVRITHPDSGAVGESRSHRSQRQNRDEAFDRLLKDPKWRTWLNRRVAEALAREPLERRVERMMEEATVEVREDGRWVPEGDRLVGNG